MKNLHDLFDHLGTEKVKLITELQDKEASPKESGEVIALVFAAYSLETGIEPGDIVFTEDKLNSLLQTFMLSASLYVNVANGDMLIKGRMALINDKSSFSLTEQGRKNIEENLLGK